MNSTVFHRRRAERFAQLVDEASGGRRHHVRTRLDAQLAELVAIGHQMSTLPAPGELDPDFRVGLRAMLVATAEREGIGRTARPGAAEVSPPPHAHRVPASRAGSRRSPSTRPATGRIRARGAIVIGVAVGAIAVSGMSAASENALPGDALYGVKRQTERAKIALMPDDVSRGQALLDVAKTRASEAAALHQDSAAYQDVLDAMDADTQQGVRNLTDAAVRRHDPAALEVVKGFVGHQQNALGGLLDKVAADDRDRTLKSLGLLRAVDRRIEALHAAMSCGASRPVGADQLGPVPRQCGTASAPHGPAGERPANQAPTGDRTAPEAPSTGNTEQAGTPGTGSNSPDGGQAPATQQTTDTVTPVSDDDGDDGVLSDIGRMFGGLLD